MMETSCGDCRHAGKVEGDLLSKNVMCRRYPPIPYPVPQPGGQIGTLCLFPIVQKTNLCGEFAAVLQS